MAYSNTIGILIAAKDEASVVIGKAAAQTKLASAEMNGLGREASLVGSSFKGGLVLGLIAVAGESANLAIKFQQSMEMLHTNAGVAQKDIAGLSQQLLNMSGSVGQGPEQLAQAFYHIASAGTGIWDTAKQLDILKVAAMGAAIGQASLDDTTYALTSAMASNIGGVKNAAEMMAVLNATVGAGDMKLKDLNGALSTGILSTAATFGISIQSVGSALATLTDNGEHADEAATRLRMTLALMSSPSSMATKQLEALGLTAENAKVSTEGMNAVFAKSGLTTTKLADDLRKPNGIAMAIEDLKKHLNDAGLSASEADAMLSKAFGGGRTDAALLTLLQNTERLDEKFKVINSTANDFSRNYTDQQTTAAQKIRDVWATVQVKLVEIGTWLGKVADVASKYLTPAFQMIGDAWNKYIQPSFDKVIGGNGDKIVAFFGIALAVAIGLVVVPLVALGAAFAGLVVGIDYAVKWISSVVAAIPIAFQNAVKGVSDWWSKLSSDTSNWVDGIGSSISNFWQSVVKVFRDGISTVDKFWGDILSAFTKGVDAVIKWFSNFPFNIGVVLGTVSRVLYDFATVTVPSIISAIIESFIRLSNEIGITLYIFAATITKWFTSLPGLVTGALVSLWQTVTGWFNKTTEDTTKSAQQMVTSTTQAVSSLPQQIGNAIAGIWNASVQGFTDFLNNATAWAKTTVKSIVDEFTKLPGQISGLVTDAYNQVTGGASNFVNGAVNNINGGINSFLSGIGQGFQHHALGTNFAPGGMTMVGENGPELVNLPTGSKVHTARETAQMSQGSGASMTINGGIHVHHEMDESKLLAKLGWRLSLA